MSQNIIRSTAEPFYFPGGSIGCLLIHGFTGTPKEIRPLGEYLAKQGYTVLGIRLAGHATQITDMIRTRWHDWLASVEDGLNILKNNTKNIYPIGLSMGGTLALLTAARYPVTAAIAMSAPITPPQDWRLPFLRLISPFKTGIKKGHSDWQNQNRAKSHISYEKYPTKSIIELINLQEELKKNLPLIKVPVLLMHSKLDKTVTPDNMSSIYKLLNTPQKQMLWLENSGHILPHEPDSKIVFNTIHNFITNTTTTTNS